MKKALFPGTFDPPTKGHLEIISRAAPLFDQLIVGIGKNLEKGPSLLSDEEKVNSLKNATSKFSNVEIAFFSGLVTKYAKEQGIQVLIRGLRSEADFAYEMQLAHANRTMENLETFFLITDETSYISSTLIRELAANGAPLDQFVPSDLINILHSRLKKEA